MSKIDRRSALGIGLAAATAAISMRDVIMQPGSKTMGPPMENAMICHVTEGELRLEQDKKTFTAKKNFVWTCNKDTKEQAFNDGNVVAIMRITDLKA
jgi:hypothetical protein